MVGSEGLHGNPEFNRCVAVSAVELIVLQLDDIAPILSDDGGHPYKLSRTVRQKDRDGEDSVSRDQTVLNDGGHGDDIHVAAAHDCYDALIFRFQMLEGSYGEKTGVFNNHLVIFHHVQECHHELLIRNGDDFIDVLLDIWENLFAGTFYGSAVRNCVHTRELGDLAVFQGYLHAVRTCRFHTDDVDLRIQKLGEGRNAGRETASSDGYQDGIDNWELLDDFHGDGALAGRDGQIIKGMDEGVAVFRSELKSLLAGIVIDISVENNLRAVALCPLYLDQGRRCRHDNDSLAAVGFCGVRDSLCVVARGCRDETLLTVLLTHRADLIIGTANLVGAGYLHVLRLQIAAVSGLAGEIFAVYQLGVGGDPLYDL